MKHRKASAVFAGWHALTTLASRLKAWREARLHLKSQAELIRSSTFYDQAYYLSCYPDVAGSGMDPARHYLLYGGFQGKNPSRHFDSQFYLERYCDVERNGINPLLHYLIAGRSERRQIIPVDDGINTAKGLISDAKDESWPYQVDFRTGMTPESTMIRTFDRSIKQRSNKNRTAHWDSEIRDFWLNNIDRHYELEIISQRVKTGEVLDIGAEFYNRYIKEVIACGQTLTIVDLKKPDHPDIQIIEGLDDYYQFDMTVDEGSDVAALHHRYDTVISFGVLSYYDFTLEMCTRYLDNMVGFLKPDGVAIIKVDRHAMAKNVRFPSFPVLHRLIHDRFSVPELHILLDQDEEYFIYYCTTKAE